MSRIVFIATITVNVKINPIEARDYEALKERVLKETAEILDAIRPFKEDPGVLVRKPIT